MADTPLHEHEAVKHLMGTEHWPTSKYGSLKFTGDQWGGWYFGDIDGAHSWIEEAIAHSLITLAAVRGMWAKHCLVRVGQTVGGGRSCEAFVPNFDDNAWDAAKEHDTFAPTEPLAILAAYQATVMGKESSK